MRVLVRGRLKVVVVGAVVGAVDDADGGDVGDEIGKLEVSNWSRTSGR